MLMSFTGFFVKFSATSGGIFTDVGVHDIDQARWMCGVPKGCPNPKQEVSRVFAIGQAVQHPELAQLGDADNGFGIVEFTNGVNAIMHLGRIARNGHECYLELYGTESRVNVNNVRCIAGVESLKFLTVYCRMLKPTSSKSETFTVSEKSLIKPTLNDSRKRSSKSCRTSLPAFWTTNVSPCYTEMFY